MKTKILIQLLVSCMILNGTSAFGETIVVSGHPEYPPFMYRSGTEIIGVGLEIVKKVFEEELGIEVQSKFVGNWKRCLMLAEKGEIDLVVAAYNNDDRKEYLHFTRNPISQDTLSVFVAKGKEFPFMNWDDLIGKRGVSTIGDSQGQEFDDFLNNNNIKLERVKHRVQNFKKLIFDRADFYPGGKYATSIILERNKEELKKMGGEIVELPNPLNVIYLHIAISKTSKFTKYLNKLDESLKKFSENGATEKLLNKYTKLAASADFENY